MNVLRRYIRIVEGASDGGAIFYEFVHEVASKMTAEYRSGVPHQPWRVVPAQRLITIWKNAARDGFVRDEKGLDEIAQQMVENVARLFLNNEVSEHGTISTAQAIETYFDGSWIDDHEAFVEWAIETPTGWRISDYGIGPLCRLAFELLENPPAEEKLVLIDRMLNVTHQRSDLASWFVEGGTATLDRLKND